MPKALVKRILQGELNLPVPVSIQKLWACLGIAFEGGLMTNAKQPEGTILVERGREPHRRFTVAHELGPS